MKTAQDIKMNTDNGSSEDEAEVSEMDLLLPTVRRKSSSRGTMDTPTKRKYALEFQSEASPPEKEFLHFDKSDFDPDVGDYMVALIEEANRVLWHWKTFPINLPQPIESKIEPQHGLTSSMRKKTLNLKDLFVEPNFDEMKSIAINSKGKLKKLTEHQLESVKQTGEFEVDSQEFPGQKHRWIITQLLIKGRQKSYSTLLDNLAKCLYLIAGVSRSLCDHILESVNGWSVGVNNLLMMLIGTPQIEIVNLASKLQAERAKYLVADLKEAPCEEGKVLALCNFILFKQQNSQNEETVTSKPPQVPYLFLTPQGLQIDLRLCNQELMRSAKPHLLHILNSAMKDWIPDKKKELLKQYRNEDISDETEIASKLTKAITEEYFGRVSHLIYEDQGIERLGGKKEGIVDLLVDQAKTAKIIGEAIKQYEQQKQQNRAIVQQKLQQSSPILSRVDAWLTRQLGKAECEFVEQTKWSPHQEAIKQCKSQGLEQSAYFLAKDLSFRRDHEPMLAKELRKTCKQPAKEFSFQTRIWNPKNWVVTELGTDSVIPTEVLDNSDDDDTLSYIPHHKRRSHEDQEKGLWSSSSKSKTTESVSYSVCKKTTVTTNSGHIGWRWCNFFYRTSAFFWNTLFFFGIVVPWCTPLSLRALFCEEPFYPQHILDAKTGVIKKDRASKTHTVMSRVFKLWSHIRQERKDFESRPDTGLLSKAMSRHFHRFINYVLKGFFGTALIVTVLPVSMLFVSLLSIFLALTAPFYVWVGSAALHLLAFLLFDIETKTFLTAVVWNVLVNFLGIGILQPIICSLVAFVLCPLGCFIGCFLSLARKGIRDAWDTVIFQLVIKIHGRIPLTDTFLARRIAGPGMASNYYYQIKTEQALAALESAMDLDHLAAYQADVTKQIRRPEEEYLAFARKHFGPFGMEANSEKNSPYRKIVHETKMLVTQLSEKVARRRELFENKLPSGTRSIIRLTELDLKLVLQQGTALVETFYKQNVMPKMTESEVDNFWATKSLKREDWLGLTAYLYSVLFSPEFLIPLQDVDSTFLLKVKHWNLSRYINMALDANWKDDLDVTKVIQTPKLQSFVTQPDIPLESFNPLAYISPSPSRERKDQWLIYRKTKKDLSTKLSNPPPLPHPIEISVIISNRESFTRSQLKLDNMSYQSMLRLLQEESQSAMEFSFNSPTSLKLSEPGNKKFDSMVRDSTLKEDESLTDMDPAMASLTQSLEELDKEVESESKKLKKKFTYHIGDAKLTGSVPLLASTEDISVMTTSHHQSESPIVAKKVVNPDSYSTIV